MIKKNIAITFLIYTFFAVIISLSFLNYSVELSYIKNARFFDSDMLYLHQMFEDIFILKHSFFSWHLTPAPYFFPDMFVFFIIEEILKQRIFFVIIAYAIFQYLLLVFLAQQLATTVMRGKQATWLIYSALLITLIFWVLPEKAPYYFSISSAYHFGGFINGLFLILLIVKANNRPYQKLNFIIISIVSALGSASDMLFIMQFLSPVLLSWMLFYGYKHKYIFALLIGSIAGLIIKQLVTFNVLATFIHINPYSYFSNLKRIAQLHLRVLHGNPCAEYLCLYFYAWLFFDTFRFLFNKKKSTISLLKLIVISSVLITTFGLALFKVTPTWYMLNYYYFPIIFCWLPFFSILRKRFFLKTQFFIFLTVSATAIYSLMIEKNVLYSEYYPPVIKCIDDGINQYNISHYEKIKYGIANYWYARVITALSKNKLQLSPVTQQLRPVYWISDSENQRQNYDFAIITLPSERNTYRRSTSFMLNHILIQHINGSPAATFECNNEVIVMIYGKNKLRLLKNSRQPA